MLTFNLAICSGVPLTSSVCRSNTMFLSILQQTTKALSILRYINFSGEI